MKNLLPKKRYSTTFGVDPNKSSKNPYSTIFGVDPKFMTGYTAQKSRKQNAERGGFEPSVRFPAHLISSQAQSTTLSSLLKSFK